jgi:hypothetical protein
MLLDLLNLGFQISINSRDFHSEFLFNEVDLGFHVCSELRGGISKIHRNFQLAFCHLLTQL